LGNTNTAMQCHNPEDLGQPRRCENLKYRKET